MDALFSWLGGFGSAISGAFDFLVDLVLDLVYLVQVLGRFLGLIPVFFSWIPAPLMGIITVAISMAVIFKILGR